MQNVRESESFPASGPAGYDALGEAKRLLRVIRSGALATLIQASGHPFASLVNVATEPDGTPILLLSRLAIHTANLEADPRCSLLLAEGGRTSQGRGDPLACPRLTIVGNAVKAASPGTRGRFLRRHPKSQLYADFRDFALWRVDILGAHLNGGFARAADFPADKIRTSLIGARDLVNAEEEILARLNSDGTLGSLVMAELSRPVDGEWRVTGLDPEGLDLACGEASVRVRFPNPVSEPDAVTLVLARMANAAGQSDA